VERRAAYNAVIVRLGDLFYFVEKNRIYLAEGVCDLLKSFIDIVRKSAIDINIFVPTEQPINQKLLEEKVKVVTQVYEAFRGSIPEARTALEKEFRTILGG
jgi:hypothetical protein